MQSEEKPNFKFKEPELGLVSAVTMQNHHTKRTQPFFFMMEIMGLYEMESIPTATITGCIKHASITIVKTVVCVAKSLDGTDILDTPLPVKGTQWHPVSLHQVVKRKSGHSQEEGPNVNLDWIEDELRPEVGTVQNGHEVLKKCMKEIIDPVSMPDMDDLEPDFTNNL
ncbi:hypothetical protein P691DRAFT_781434 [Macrolepiota fuliginosa MF-IS2]|uniref:Uncharacterized protein n=1 Tax=Macrolepiota fuliginosa MF-IS2 TaxID=1400762 RepID=A0A9P5WYQ7_9AGAR|nr:hypothetical protein P691DRAFT_781434 [Macrolepiota fuliginosa MF-IS2]